MRVVEHSRKNEIMLDLIDFDREADIDRIVDAVIRQFDATVVDDTVGPGSRTVLLKLKQIEFYLQYNSAIGSYFSARSGEAIEVVRSMASELSLPAG